MFSKELNKRIKIIILIVSFLFILVILKVGYIQIVEYKKLNSKATSLWSRNLPIEASRGLIYDANNLIIADNITTTSLVIIPNQIKDKESVAKDLSKILNVNYDEMYKHVSKKTSIERVHPEGRNLDFEVADKINKVNNIKLKSGNKFEQKFYEDEFLLASGDCKSDFEIVLNNFLIDYRYKYPAFEITDTLLDKVVEVFTDLSYYFSNQLCRENHLSKEQIRNKLLDYFELQGVV